MRVKADRRGKAPLLLALALSIVLSSSIALGAFNLEDVNETIGEIAVSMQEGLEIVSSKSYEICSNVKWTEIKATGVKATEMGLDGFLQVCERLALNLGNLKVYADIECRLLWVYSDSDASEAYYVQFK